MSKKNKCPFCGFGKLKKIGKVYICNNCKLNFTKDKDGDYIVTEK